MKTNSIIAIVLVLSGFLLTSCEAIGAIFNAGVYTGIFMVVLFIALILFAISRLRKRD